MLDSDLLITFIAVAATKNFTKAGEQLGRTQSAISAQMKRLEDRLGEALFNRESRGVQLTEKGEELLIRARRIVNMIEETEGALKSTPVSKIVRLGVTEEVHSRILPAVLSIFNHRHPDFELIVRTAPSVMHLASIASRSLDLAIVYDREGSETHELLMHDPVVWMTSVVHQPHLLEPLPVAMYSINTWAGTQAVELLKARGGRHQYLYHGDSSSALIPAVQAGLAIAPMARSAIPLDCRELTEEEGFPAVENSNVVLCVGPISSPAIEGLAQAIREAFRRMASI